MATSYFSGILGPLRTMLETLLSDDSFREKITYKQFGSEAFDAVLGYNVVTWSELVLWGVRMRHNRQSVKSVSAQSGVEEGDLLFLFNKEGFPAGASLKDQLVDANGIVMTIKSLDPILELAMRVTVGGE